MATKDDRFDRPDNWDGKAAEPRLTGMQQMHPPFLHTHGGINHAGGTVPETHDVGHPAQDWVEKGPGGSPREAPPRNRDGDRRYDVI